MKRVKDIAFISTLSFSLLMLVFCFMESVASNEFDAQLIEADRFANNALVLFVYSICIGLSFLLFDIKAFSQTVKRGIHFVLNYGFMLLFVFGFAKVVVGDKAAIAFATSFVFIAVYFLGMLISSLFRKLDAFLQSAKK